MLNTYFLEALYGTLPKVYIRVHRVFYHYGYVHTPKRISQVLYLEGVYGGAGTYLKYVYVVPQG